MDLPDIQWYVKSCGYNQLFVKNKRDTIIIYCFTHDNTCSKTLLTINILDNHVYIEAWIIGSVEKDTISKTAIDSLLKRLGQQG